TSGRRRARRPSSRPDAELPVPEDDALRDRAVDAAGPGSPPVRGPAGGAAPGPAGAPSTGPAVAAAAGPAPGRWGRFALAFWSGFAVLVIEIAGARMIAPVFGLSAIPWTAVIGVVLAALAVGSHL